jgi:hypothetical protein
MITDHIKAIEDINDAHVLLYAKKILDNAYINIVLYG